ncbi:transcription factor 25 [Daktulosphaira vitifoliae]|uniref:transcription factor 25 n=1 Tax=Daktulosphaira vitifoliae TaxID=58002 RepID=UPI0021A9D8CA|nr:transcription factor 25 [Daktulosphaira vitifoliae]
MSTRVLRKMGLQDLPPANDESSDDTETSSGGVNKKRHLNMYDLLNVGSMSESEVKEDDDHETTGSLKKKDDHLLCDKENIRRKKKKKRKKSCKVLSSHTRSSEDNVDDEVERSVREVNKILGEVSYKNKDEEATSFQSNLAQNKECIYIKNILSVQHRNLNPNNELRKMFGRVVHQAELSKRKFRGRNHLKTTWLVTPKDNWPPVGKSGSTMKYIETKNGIMYFAFEHNPEYQQVQLQLYDAVSNMSQQHLVNIINNHPYHVDVLLQMTEWARLSEDLPVAAELTEQALYSLENSFHPMFSLSNGKCRLDYRLHENRALFLALYRHLTFVGLRACYRTALEFCKLLLSLSPMDDPLAIVLCIDFYALRSSEYTWFIHFVNAFDPIRNLTQLPNIKFSLAVAKWQKGDVETAHTLLQESLIMFPGVLILLLDKCSIQPDKRVSNHPFFTTYANETQPKALSYLISMYVTRSYHVWKEVQLLPWLERNVQIVLDRVDAKDPLVKTMENLRSTLFSAKTPLNIHRHLLLSDMSDTIAPPAEAVTSPILIMDPFPPPDGTSFYNSRTTNDSSSRSPVQNQSLFSTFFRSLNPVFQALSDDNAIEEDITSETETVASRPVITMVGEQIEEMRSDLRQSVNSLLDAMRDLLSSVHAPNVPADGDIDDDSELSDTA